MGEFCIFSQLKRNDSSLPEVQGFPVILPRILGSIRHEYDRKNFAIPHNMVIAAFSVIKPCHSKLGVSLIK